MDLTTETFARDVIQLVKLDAMAAGVRHRRDPAARGRGVAMAAAGVLMISVAAAVARIPELR